VEAAGVGAAERRRSLRSAGEMRGCPPSRLHEQPATLRRDTSLVNETRWLARTKLAEGERSLEAAGVGAAKRGRSLRLRHGTAAAGVGAAKRGRSLRLRHGTAAAGVGAAKRGRSLRLRHGTAAPTPRPSVARDWWRRRESNPRPKARRRGTLHACPRLKSRAPREDAAKTAKHQPRRISQPRAEAPRGRQPVSWRSTPDHQARSGRTSLLN